MEKGYFQNRLSNVKGLNIDPIRNEVQALKNVRDFCCLQCKFHPGLVELMAQVNIYIRIYKS